MHQQENTHNCNQIIILSEMCAIRTHTHTHTNSPEKSYEPTCLAT